MANATDNGILDTEALRHLTGLQRVGDIEKRLRSQGILPFHGARGRIFITRDQLNAARGIKQNDHGEMEEPLL